MGMMSNAARVGTLLVLAAVSAAAEDMKPLPGVDVMNRGFNMIDGTQLADGSAKPLFQLFDLHYTMGQSYTPVGSDVKFAVPDEMVATDNNMHIVNSDEGLTTSYSDYLQSRTSSFNVAIGVKVADAGGKAFSGNFKYDRQSSKMKEKIQNSSDASGTSKNVYSYYSLASLPPQFMTLDPRLTLALKQLPAKISTGADQSKYNTVVQYWGSHFVMSANFGGKINLDTFVSNSYVKSKSQSFLAQQFSLNFHYQMFDLSSGGYHNKSDIKLDESFKQAATTSMYFYGGDPLKAENTSLPEWLKTLSSHAHYLNCTIADITEVFGDGMDDQRALMQSTIKVLISTGKLPEISDSVDYDKLHASYDHVPVIPSVRFKAKR